MQRLLIIILVGFLGVATVSPTMATASEMRFALVIGNASYKTNALATTLNDASLIAKTLEGAGFKVDSEGDLTGERLRKAFNDFRQRVRKAGPDAIVFVYFAGYGLQLEGENYLFPIDADGVPPENVPVRAVRLSEEMRALAALHLKAGFLIIDAARTNPSLVLGPPAASGLAWVAPDPDMLVAFNAAPGTVAGESGAGYGAYAKALAEMLRDGGQTPSELFDRVRLRVNELTKGAQVPWNASKIRTPFVFFDRSPGAPARANTPDRISELRTQPLRSLGATDAYFVTLLRDTLDGYADFVANYWQDPMAKRIEALLAARREAITWGRTCQTNVPEAYWTYLVRYPRGPHAADARRLLSRLGASSTLPSKFARIEYDVPPPLPDELPYIERIVLNLDDPEFAFEPPPPLPAYFLGPPPAELAAFPQPAAPGSRAPLAPMGTPPPAFAKLPTWVVLPSSLAPHNAAGLVFRGAIDAPIRRSDQVTTPLRSNEADDRKPGNARPKPVTSSRKETRAPSQASDPSTAQQAKDQTISNAGVQSSPPLVADERPIYTPVMVPERVNRPPQVHDEVQRPFGTIPLPKSRRAVLKRPSSVVQSPPRRAEPQVTSSVSPPKSLRNPLKPTARAPAAPARGGGASPNRPPGSPLQLSSKPCTVVDGKRSCD